MQSNQNADKAGDFANKEFKQKEGESHIPHGTLEPGSQTLQASVYPVFTKPPHVPLNGRDNRIHIQCCNE